MIANRPLNWLRILVVATAVAFVSCGPAHDVAGLGDEIDRAANEMTVKGESTRLIEYRSPSSGPYSLAVVPAGGLKTAPESAKKSLQADHCDSDAPMIIVANVDETQCVTLARIRVNSLIIATKAAGDAAQITIVRDAAGFLVSAIR